jgi:hypothetical protein
MNTSRCFLGQLLDLVRRETLLPSQQIQGGVEGKALYNFDFLELVANLTLAAES